MASQIHLPVLLAEVLEALKISATGIYMDCTFGRGGHSWAILQALGAEGRLLAIDKDPDAVAWGMESFGADKRFLIEQGSFVMLEEITSKCGLTGKVDGILLDLGVSSPQLESPQRGFSFLKDGPLDMRMDNTRGISAAEWLASADEVEIAKVLKAYGEERFAKRIARAIVNSREETPIVTTGELAELIKRTNPIREKSKHPATRSFQAIRIHINSELSDLETCLPLTLGVLKPAGRLVVISFHSLEDRIVKRFMRNQSRGDLYPRGVPVTHTQIKPRLRRVGKAVRPASAEVMANPHARSAVMRVAERLA